MRVCLCQEPSVHARPVQLPPNEGGDQDLVRADKKLVKGLQ